jgi:hypothetical protein
MVQCSLIYTYGSINYIFETDSKTVVDALLTHNIPLNELFETDSKTLMDVLPACLSMNLVIYFLNIRASYIVISTSLSNPS